MSNGDAPRGLAIESYTLEPAAPVEGLALDVAGATPLRLTLRGQGFFIGAVDPVIHIGDTPVRDFEILNDERTIVATLHELPPEGAPISISFPGGRPATAAEPFSLERLAGPAGPADPVV